MPAARRTRTRDHVRFPDGALGQLVGSRTRLRLLHLFLRFPRYRFFGFELAALVQVRPSAVQRELRRLERVGLVTRIGGRYRVFYQVNRRAALFPALQRLFEHVRLAS